MMIEQKKSLFDLLQNIHDQLDSKDFVKLHFEDFIKYIPSYFDEEELSKESIKYLAEQFENLSLDSEPRIRQGFVKRKIYSPIFIYKRVGAFKPLADSYRHGFLMVRMAMIMALADGKVANREMLAIRRMIWDMNFLSQDEKSSLFTKVNYFFSTDEPLDKQTRDHIRFATNKTTLIEKMKDLSPSTLQSLLQVAKDIAISDGFLDRGEISLLQDMYREFGMSARSTKPDIEKYAAEQYISLKTKHKKELIPEAELDEIDDVLGDLLTDFDDF